MSTKNSSTSASAFSPQAFSPFPDTVTSCSITLCFKKILCVPSRGKNFPLCTHLRTRLCTHL